MERRLSRLLSVLWFGEEYRGACGAEGSGLC